MNSIRFQQFIITKHIHTIKEYPLFMLTSLIMLGKTILPFNSLMATDQKFVMVFPISAIMTHTSVSQEKLFAFYFVRVEGKIQRIKVLLLMKYSLFLWYEVLEKLVTFIACKQTNKQTLYHFAMNQMNCDNKSVKVFSHQKIKNLKRRKISRIMKVARQQEINFYNEPVH